MGDILLPLRVVVKKSAAAFVQLKINIRVRFLSIFGLRLLISKFYINYLSTLRLHDFFELFENYRNYLIYMVGPLGLEPRTNGL